MLIISNKHAFLALNKKHTFAHFCSLSRTFSALLCHTFSAFGTLSRTFLGFGTLCHTFSAGDQLVIPNADLSKSAGKTETDLLL